MLRAMGVVVTVARLPLNVWDPQTAIPEKKSATVGLLGSLQETVAVTPAEFWA